MMKMQRLERGVCPIGSFFSGSQYLVQHTLLQPRRINWKDKLERRRSFVLFDYLLSKDSKMLNTSKKSHVKKVKNSYPPNTSKGQMVFWNVVFYLSTSTTLEHRIQEGVCEGSCHCWVWEWKNRSVLDHLVESPPFVTLIIFHKSLSSLSYPP